MPSLECGALDGTTSLTRTPPKGTDTRLDHGGMIGASVAQEGTVNCTFTDTNNKFEETASCLLNFEWRNLKEECVNNNNGSSTLTVTGTPVATIPLGEGTIGVRRAFLSLCR